MQKSRLIAGLQPVRVVATAAIIVAAVAGAWLLEGVLRARTESALSDYRVSVIRDGKTLDSFDIGELESMESRRVVMQGAFEAGPPLLTVLEEAGVTEFDGVVVTGYGARDSGRIELTRDQIDENVLLDLAKRGTTKICGPNISREERVRDVTRIEVR